MMTEQTYPCEFCDTKKEQTEKFVTLTMKRDNRWYIFENVPAHVCPNCGHRYFDGPKMIELEQMMKNRPDAARQVEAWSVSLPKSG